MSVAAAAVLLVALSPFVVTQHKAAKLAWNYMMTTTTAKRQAGYLFHISSRENYLDDIRCNEAGQWLLARFQRLMGPVIVLRDEMYTAQRHLNALAACIASSGVFAALWLAVRSTSAGPRAAGNAALLIGSVTALAFQLILVVNAVAQLLANAPYMRALEDAITLHGPPSQREPFLGAQVAKASSAAGFIAPGQSAGTTQEAGAVRLRDVWFSYPNSTSCALRGVTVDIPAGASVAIKSARLRALEPGPRTVL